MNSLSWLLYLGGVSQNFGGLLIFLGIVVGILGIIALVAAISLREDWNKEVRSQLYFRVPEGESTEVVVDAVTAKIKKLAKPFPFWPSALCFVIAFIFWTTAAFMPSKDTVYAIAASEMGEKAIASPIGQKAGRALEAWLERQTNPPVVPAQAQ